MLEKQIERFSTTFQITDSNLELGQFEGMASVFGSLVQGCWLTVIHPGAFTKTLAENSSRIKVLWQHNPDHPIGKPILMEERPTGLFVRAQLSKTMMGNDCMTLLRDGVVDELSIGFDPIKYEFVEEEGKETVRHLRELRLWEFSPVTFAADPMARITEANRALRGTDSQNFESFLVWLKETHEGKVLSKKNKTIVQDAIAALQALLTAAEPPEADDAQALTRNVEALLRDLELDGMARGVPVLNR